MQHPGTRLGQRAVALLLALVVSAAAGARAQSGDDPTEMSRDMHVYFRGELDESAVFGGLGAGSGYIGGALLARATDATRAAAVPVLAVGAIELGAAVVLLVRTGSQVRDLDMQIAMHPEVYAREERARMERVDFWFGVYRTIEMILMVGGAGTAALGMVLDEDLALGAGLGLASQAAVMLSLDAFAEARAERYLDSIRRFSASPLVPAGEHPAYGLSLGAIF